MSAAACPQCGASIFWADSKHGKHMMMDSEPDQTGGHGDFRTYVLEVREGANPVAYVMGSTDAMLFGDMRIDQRYTCHFDTCAAKRKSDRAVPQ